MAFYQSTKAGLSTLTIILETLVWIEVMKIVSTNLSCFLFHSTRLVRTSVAPRYRATHTQKKDYIVAIQIEPKNPISEIH